MKDDTSHKALDFSCKIFVKVYLYVHLFEHDTSVYHVFNKLNSIRSSSTPNMKKGFEK